MYAAARRVLGLKSKSVVRVVTVELRADISSCRLSHCVYTNPSDSENEAVEEKEGRCFSSFPDWVDVSCVKVVIE